MTPTTVFSIVNSMALPMWILMILLPRWKITKFLMMYKIVPLGLALIYALYVVEALLVSGIMDFSSLSSVTALFSSETAVLTGWVHYLAFDLLVGMWMLEKNTEIGIHKGLMAICLLATFMFGPIGFLLLVIIKSLKTKSDVAV